MNSREEKERRRKEFLFPSSKPEENSFPRDVPSIRQRFEQNASRSVSQSSASPTVTVSSRTRPTASTSFDRVPVTKPVGYPVSSVVSHPRQDKVLSRPNFGSGSSLSGSRIEGNPAARPTGSSSNLSQLGTQRDGSAISRSPGHVTNPPFSRPTPSLAVPPSRGRSSSIGQVDKMKYRSPSSDRNYESPSNKRGGFGTNTSGVKKFNSMPRLKLDSTRPTLGTAFSSNPNTPGIDDKEYSNKKTKVIIFSQETFKDLDKREGAEKDVDNLREALPKMGISRADIIVYRDKTYSEIQNILEKLSEGDYTWYDSLMIFIMSHGDDRDNVYVKDGRLSADSIWTPFLADKCPGLKAKPKMFFIVACRGSQTDSGVQIPNRSRKLSTTMDAAPVQTSSYVIPIQADVLTVYSTMPGHYSYRESDSGTWYIEQLCKEIGKLEPNTKVNIFDLLVSVNRSISIVKTTYNLFQKEYNEKKQCSTFTSTLTRSLYFTIPPRK